MWVELLPPKNLRRKTPRNVVGLERPLPVSLAPCGHLGAQAGDNPAAYTNVQQGPAGPGRVSLLCATRAQEAADGDTLERADLICVEKTAGERGRHGVLLSLTHVLRGAGSSPCLQPRREN